MRDARRISHVTVAVAIMALGACASVPTHFYTLQHGAGTRANVPAVTPTFLIDVLPVSVPAQIDQPELLVRQSDQRVDVLDNERWAAPVAAELRDAFAADLVGTLGTRDVHSLAHPPATPVYRIEIDVRRFDSWPDHQALIEADWSVRGDAERALLTCTSSASENVEPGYDALVQGHQRAIGRIADDIAAVLRSIAAGTEPTCPR